MEEISEVREREDSELKEMFVNGRLVDDEAFHPFHPLPVSELEQRRLRRSVRPSKPQNDAA